MDENLLRAFLCCAAATVLGCTPQAQQPKGDLVVPRPLLSELAGPATSAQVLVLATPHLREVESWDPRMVERLVDALADWRPTMIMVEVMPPADIAAALHGDETARAIAEAYAPATARLGREMQTLLALDSRAAGARSGEILQRSAALDGAARCELVGLLLAAYELPTAALHWSLVPQAARAATTAVPAAIAAELESLRQKADETFAIGAAVARRTGVHQLHGVDDHHDDLYLLTLDPAELQTLTEHPLYEQTAGAKLYAESAQRLQAAAAAGDLLPYYEYLSSPAYLAGDVQTQWGFFLRTGLPSGVDRYRYALWEARNQAIAANIFAHLATRRPQRALVIFGAAHKPFLDAALAQSAIVDLVHPLDVL